MKDCRECTSGDRQVFIIIITCYWSLSFPSKREKKKIMLMMLLLIATATIIMKDFK